MPIRVERGLFVQGASDCRFNGSYKKPNRSPGGGR